MEWTLLYTKMTVHAFVYIHVARHVLAAVTTCIFMYITVILQSQYT